MNWTEAMQKMLEGKKVRGADFMPNTWISAASSTNAAFFIYTDLQSMDWEIYEEQIEDVVKTINEIQKIKVSKKYYALSDTFFGDYPENWSRTITDRPEVIFFDSDKAREKWLNETKLGTARLLSRSEAIRYSRQLANGDRVARPVRRPDEEFDRDYVIRRSKQTLTWDTKWK